MTKWEYKTVGDFLSLQRGHDLTSEERENGRVPVMGAAGQNGFHNKALAKAPGVIVGRSGGSFGQVYFSSEDFWPHNTAMYVTDFKGNDPYFTYYLLKNINFDRLNSGSAQPSLNRNFVYPVKVSVPKPKEQSKITAVLSSLDQKIEINNRINAELEAMAKTLYDYWFVQFDFPDENGKPYKSSGGKMLYSKELKREIPAGWKNKGLAEIFPISNDSLTPSSTPEKLFEYYSIPYFDVSGGYFIEKGGNIGSNKFIVDDNSLLISKLNPWFNRVVFPPKENNMICSTEFVVLKTSSNALKCYLYKAIKDQHFIEYCINSASGTSNSHKRVNPSVMGKYWLAFSKIHADLFGGKVHPIIEKIERNKQENQRLVALRDWLLPMLMNGQVRVESSTQEVQK